MSNQFSLEQRAEILDSAESFASYVARKWPQINHNGEVNYSFVGSLAVLLLANAKSMQPSDTVFSEPKQVPATVRDKLYSFIRPIGDLDFLPSKDYLRLPLGQRLGKGGGGPTIAELPENAKKALVIPENMCKFMCDIVDNYGSNETVKIDCKKDSYLIQGPQNLFGHKILNVIQSFHMKPEKFKKDFNILHSAFSEMYSADILLSSVYDVLQGYETSSAKWGPRVRTAVERLYAQDEFNGNIRNFFNDLREFELDNHSKELVRPHVPEIIKTGLKVGLL